LRNIGQLPRHALVPDVKASTESTHIKRFTYPNAMSDEEVVSNKFHYYRTDLCSRPFVPVAFGPGTKGGFCPGSDG
jgi:hypothetical protein